MTASDIIKEFNQHGFISTDFFSFATGEYIMLYSNTIKNNVKKNFKYEIIFDDYGISEYKKVSLNYIKKKIDQLVFDRLSESVDIYEMFGL